MRKILIVCILTLLAVAGLSACSGGTSGGNLESIAVYPQSIQLSAGDSTSTELVVTPSDSDSSKILWVSSNESVATVDNKGNITAVGDGVCTITAASSEYSSIFCDVQVTVTSEGTAPVASVTTKTAKATTSAADVYPAYYLSSSEVASMTSDEIQFVINQIYAKNGYIFKTQSLQDYFSAQSWYTPVTSDMGAISFSKMDKTNINLLIKYRDGGAASSTASTSTAAAPASSETLWTYSYVQQTLTDSMVSGYSKDDIQLMINTIYAMNGYIFKKDNYKQLFGSQSWYHGTTSDMGSISFSSRDKANLDLLLKYR